MSFVEVYYLYEVCQPAVTHTTALLLLMCVHTTGLVTGFNAKLVPGELDSSEPSAVGRTH